MYYCEKYFITFYLNNEPIKIKNSDLIIPIPSTFNYDKTHYWFHLNPGEKLVLM